METSRLDVLDDAQCARAYEVVAASKGHGRPWHAPPSLEESVLEWRHEDVAESTEMWAAGGGGALVGVAILSLPMTDNTSLMWAQIHVHPQHRCRGAGSALLERLVERARAEHRTRIVAELLVPARSGAEHPYRRFARRHGFTLGHTEVIRHLGLPVPAAVLDALAEDARPHYEGSYRLETHVDGVPSQQHESLCSLMNQLAVDAPTGTLTFEEESLTPARYEEYLDLERAQRRTRLTTVAVEESSGAVVAFTDLLLPAGAPTRVWQWGTLVHRAHRGQRLGTAVKVANLRRLQADHPGREVVSTGNDDTNRWMVDINERLGFRVVELRPSYQLQLG